MFATFKTVTASTSGGEEASRTSKRKRTTVDRACDRCRLNRIKCNIERPCRNCQSTGRQCLNNGSQQTANASDVNREVEKLRAQVAELECRLRENQARTAALPLSPPSSEATPVAFGNQECKRSDQKGAWISDPDSHQKHYFGPLSLAYFVHRMQTWISRTFSQGTVPNLLALNTAGSAFAIPSELSLQRSALLQTSSKIENSSTEHHLNRLHEEVFINLFWQSTYVLTPVIDQSEFMDYYDSLWTSTSPSLEESRSPSPLVDILVALGMQYGSHLTISIGEISESSSEDSGVAGYWLYRRCEMLLSREREHPSLHTIQCQIYCILYLVNASLMNMADSTLAGTIRLAHTLGLHRTPHNDPSPDRRNLYHRTWFNLVFLDSKMSMRLGQPFLIDPSDVTFGLPSKEEDAAAMSGTDRYTYEDVNLLTYHTSSVKLILAARRVYEELKEKYLEVTRNNDGKDIHDDSNLLEDLAKSIPQAMKSLKKWILEVPDALKNRRKGSAEPFSAIRGPLDIDYEAPIWLQRQRILLELLYHNLVLLLLRSFIRFYPGTSFLTPVAAALSNSCINHAAMCIDIVHQVLAETDLLNSWHQVYLYTWDAALSSIGFALAHPLCPFTPTARRSINTAISCFDSFEAQNVVAAKSTVKMARSFNTMLDTLGFTLRGNIRPRAETKTPCAPNGTPSNVVPSRAATPVAQTPLDTQAATPDTFSPGAMTSGMLGTDFSSDMFSMFDDAAWLAPNGLDGTSNIWPD